MRLGELASVLNGRVEGDPSLEITGIASLEDAVPGDVVFFGGGRYLKRLGASRGSAVIVSEADRARAASALPGAALIVVRNAQVAFADALSVFRPARRPAPGIDPGAFVHKAASVGKGVHVGPFAVVEEGARVGDGAVLMAGTFVGAGASIGAGSLLYPGVRVLERCVVGANVIIHSNSVIGSDGFGYARDGNSYRKIPQTGTVRVGDDVEIGACVTIDRATLGETVVGRGVKIDNLVQIAHNVKVGEDTVIVAQSGIAGSTNVGSRVQLAGQSGLVGHIEIGDDAMVGAKSAVINDVPAGAVVSGYPAVAHADWLRSQAMFMKLPELKKKLQEMEKRIEELEAGRAGR